MSTLAIDQGTTSTRAVIVDTQGRAQVIHSATHRQSYPHPGWVEHDPAELLANLVACLEAARGLAGIGAAGLANQGESCLGWDADTGMPVGPVIVWQDSRTASVIARLEADGLGPEVMARAGLPLDAYFSAAKLGWILREIPEARRLADRGRLRLGTTDAWFRDRLTGRFETDVTTAARTSLMNLARCDWDMELCRIFGVPVEALPVIGPSTGGLGHLPGGIPLMASLVDQQAALYGHGCRAPGEAKVTFGTGAFVLAVTQGLRDLPANGPLQTIAWQRAGEAPARALDAGVTAAASAVNWARGLGLFHDYSQINHFDGPPAINRGLFFVPALAGLGCPHWDRDARGAWLGMSLASGPGDLMQALLEGIALRVAEAVQAIAAVQPLRGVLSVDGGLAANAYLMQFLADTLGQDLLISDEAELTAIGAARLAAETASQPFAFRRGGKSVTPACDGSGRMARFAQARATTQDFAVRLCAGPPLVCPK